MAEAHSSCVKLILQYRDNHEFNVIIPYRQAIIPSIRGNVEVVTGLQHPVFICNGVQMDHRATARSLNLEDSSLIEIHERSPSDLIAVHIVNRADNWPELRNCLVGLDTTIETIEDLYTGRYENVAKGDIVFLRKDSPCDLEETLMSLGMRNGSKLEVMGLNELRVNDHQQSKPMNANSHYVDSHEEDDSLFVPEERHFGSPAQPLRPLSSTPPASAQQQRKLEKSKGSASRSRSFSETSRRWLEAIGEVDGYSDVSASNNNVVRPLHPYHEMERSMLTEPLNIVKASKSHNKRVTVYSLNHHGRTLAPQSVQHTSRAADHKGEPIASKTTKLSIDQDTMVEPSSSLRHQKDQRPDVQSTPGSEDQSEYSFDQESPSLWRSKHRVSRTQPITPSRGSSLPISNLPEARPRQTYRPSRFPRHQEDIDEGPDEADQSYNERNISTRGVKVNRMTHRTSPPRPKVKTYHLYAREPSSSTPEVPVPEFGQTKTPNNHEVPASFTRASRSALNEISMGARSYFTGPSFTSRSASPEHKSPSSKRRHRSPPPVPSQIAPPATLRLTFTHKPGVYSPLTINMRPDQSLGIAMDRYAKSFRRRITDLDFTTKDGTMLRDGDSDTPRMYGLEDGDIVLVWDADEHDK